MWQDNLNMHTFIQHDYCGVAPGEEVPAVSVPVVHQDLLHGHVATSEDGQPCQHSPDSILLSDMIASCSVEPNIEGKGKV